MQYDVVFEGGGAKGVAFVGAWREFERRGCKARRFVGTSAGAIAATVLAAGWDAQGLEDIMTERMPDGNMRLATFTDVPKEFSNEIIEESLSRKLLSKVPMPFVPQFMQELASSFIARQAMILPQYRMIFSLIEKGGIYSGDAFLEWITDALRRKNARLANATFEEFQAITKNDLTIVATDTTGHEMLVLNSRTAPDCPVTRAARMSMSIPFLWQEIKWESSWGLYRGEDITGHTIVDGGVLSGFPLDLIVSKDREVEETMGPQTDTPPLGFLIDEKKDVPKNRTTVAQNNQPRMFDLIHHAKTINRIEALINTSIDARDKFVIDAYEQHIVRLPARKYKAIDFNMSEEDLKALVKAAENATSEYLDQVA